MRGSILSLFPAFPANAPPKDTARLPAEGGGVCKLLSVNIIVRWVNNETPLNPLSLSQFVYERGLL